MAEGVNKGIDIKFMVLLLAATAVFVMLAAKHYQIDQVALRSFRDSSQAALTIAGAKSGLMKPCAEGEELVVFSPTVYICDEPQNKLVYEEIYKFYPSTADGREIMYTFMDQGNKSRADEMLENVYDLERYPASTFTSPLTWTEDPYGERYWRFLFYSLRPLRHLIATAEETGSERYYDKIREITGGFIDNGMDKEHSWDDAHGVAFRTMMLVNVWWKLREAGELPSELSDKILAALEVHGDFLLDPNNYEDDYNHAITQSAALLLLAEAFPDLANATAWKETALRRVDISLSSIIDPNGVLVENSPYYHFYVLEKYWEIYNYTERHSISVSSNFEETINSMVNFSTYVLTPDLSVPLLGASSPRHFVRSGEYRQIAENDPIFNYVITQGQEGKPPKEKNVLFPSSGIVLLRSGWGEDRPFLEESQLTFDTGPYRTDHSDYDALTFSLFAHQLPIIRDAGLYTYEEEHPFYNYFHGTRGHNTVMVDNLDQPTGTGQVRPIVEEDNGVTHVSAYHTLYQGVTHSRSIVMLTPDLFLIVDDLTSGSEHQYEQLFHLNEDSQITTDSNTVTGTVSKDGKQAQFAITQLFGNPTLATFKDQKDPIRGYCAGAYETLIPCHELSYTQQGSNVRYLTLIEIRSAASPSAQATYDEEAGMVRVAANEGTFNVHIEYPDAGLVDSEFIALTVESEGGPKKNVLERVKQFVNNLF
ncbi:MAG TPA: alginate lyase family protein [Candidatus Paceibacterota bacterium]